MNLGRGTTPAGSELPGGRGLSQTLTVKRPLFSPVPPRTFQLRGAAPGAVVTAPWSAPQPLPHVGADVASVWFPLPALWCPCCDGVAPLGSHRLHPRPGLLLPSTSKPSHREETSLRTGSRRHWDSVPGRRETAAPCVRPARGGPRPVADGRALRREFLGKEEN